MFLVVKVGEWPAAVRRRQRSWLQVYVRGVVTLGVVVLVGVPVKAYAGRVV